MWAFSFLFQPHGMSLYMKTNRRCPEDLTTAVYVLFWLHLEGKDNTHTHTHFTERQMR